MTDAIGYVAMAIPGIIFVFAVGMLFRNAWVYRVRTALLHADWAAYKTLPEYNVMMWRFWVWDAAKFLNWPETQEMKEARVRDKSARLGQRILKKAGKA